MLSSTEVTVRARKHNSINNKEITQIAMKTRTFFTGCPHICKIVCSPELNATISISGRKEFLDWFKKLDEWTWSHFPDPEYGEWFAYLNRRGEPTHMLKGGKWKTFFHLPRCLYMSVKLMKEMQQ